MFAQDDLTLTASVAEIYSFQSCQQHQNSMKIFCNHNKFIFTCVKYLQNVQVYVTFILISI